MRTYVYYNMFYSVHKEALMSYKTTDGLMRHLRDNGITISGSTQKRQLINTGYFHGYKGIDFSSCSKETAIYLI